jgi:hypothetical protein
LILADDDLNFLQYIAGLEEKGLDNVKLLEEYTPWYIGIVYLIFLWNTSLYTTVALAI